MRILVTGATGFVGTHLVEALLGLEQNTVVGVSRTGTWPSGGSGPPARATVRACDLCDPAEVDRLLEEVEPEQIYHLAGYASAGRSFREPEAAWEGNLTATRRLLEGVARRERLRPRILFVGSGLIYGESGEPDTVITEQSLLRPNSPYAASKAAADLASFQMSCDPGLNIVRARPFNHFGPGQSPQYAIASFARQIVAIERGQQSPRLEVGNLATVRDLTDVRDVVRAYLLLVEQGTRGEAYNIASGQSYSIQHVLNRLLELAGTKVEITKRADLMRPTDMSVPRVDVSAIQRQTGWKPRLELDQTLQDLLAFWRRTTL